MLSGRRIGLGPLGAPENGAKAGWAPFGGPVGDVYQLVGVEEGILRTGVTLRDWGRGGAPAPGGQGRAGVPAGARGGERGERGPWRLTPLASPGPQELVAELHRRALVEYVRPLFRGRLHCGSRTRSRVAGRLREDAAQLQRLFRRLVSGRGAGSGITHPRPGRGLRKRPSPSFQPRHRGHAHPPPNRLGPLPGRADPPHALPVTRGRAPRQSHVQQTRDLSVAESGVLFY